MEDEVNMDDEMPEIDHQIQLLQEAVTRAGQQEDPALLCSALTNLGQAYLDIKEAPDALTQFNEALKIANKKMDNKEIRARLFGFQGLALKMLGNYEMALQSFRKSNGIASNIRHDLLLCDSFLQIGSLQSEMGNQIETLENYTRAMEIAGRVQDGNRKMRIAGAMADTYHQQGEFKKALEYYGVACDQAMALRNRAAECSFLTKMGNVSLSAEDPKTAIIQYERALEIASIIENRGAEINILGGLFRGHALAGDVSLAIIYSEKVIQLAREINHFEAEITNIHALAMFLIEQTKYADAISYLDQGRKLAEQNHDQEWLLSMDVAAGTALYRSGDYSAAFGAFIRALGLAKSTADKHSEAEILGYLGAVQADQGLFPESITYAQSSSELAAELNEFGQVGEQQMLLAFNYHDLHQTDQAIQSCQAAIAAYEKINAAGMIEKAQAFLSELRG